MHHLAKIRRGTVLLVLVLLTAGAVSGYVLLNPRRTWEQTPTYIIDDRGQASISDNDGGLGATIAAITSNDAWNGAGAGTVIEATAGSVAGFTLGDNVPMLNFEDPTGACDGSCLAATFTGFYVTSGRGRNRTTYIVDADIVTNTAYDWTSESEPDGCSGEFFIEGVQVHEIGHALGLGHTSVAGATMYPSVAACDNGPATIAADDIAGIVDLYGSSGGGGGGGGSCTLGQPGDSCTSNSQCCSGKCRGPNGNKTCR
ncbi:MAG: hypothetical protein DWQ36_10840 [Acidobacteria bacterium]|nr:MAG: hypothetical protein DWQ30_12560 [Acidobacteriota bacterium]REK07709.1 MAG: hypothetical protein DWQ36_10840 [Acidobacteriota bacterium]